LEIIIIHELGISMSQPFPNQLLTLGSKVSSGGCTFTGRFA